MVIAGIGLVFVIGSFGWLVYGRYVLNSTPTWVEQTSLVLIVWITFIGAAVGVHRGTHLSIDFLREGLPSNLRNITRVLSDLVVLLFGIAMIWNGYDLVQAGMGRLIPMLGISEAWRVTAIPASGVLIVAFTMLRLNKNIKQLVTRKQGL